MQATPASGREGVAMQRLIRIGLLLPLLASACATPQEQVADREDRLAAAGFHARPADTPQREALLQRLPPQRFVVLPVRGRDLYVYADPLVCGCLYVGPEASYDLYRQQVFQHRLADEPGLAAPIEANAGWSLDDWDGSRDPGRFGRSGSGPY